MNKAYSYQDDSGDVVIVYGETRNKVKVEIQGTYGVNYTDIRVKRASWADKYGSVENIPDKAWLDNDYAVKCNECGEFCYEHEGKWLEDGRWVCEKCSDWIKEKRAELASLHLSRPEVRERVLAELEKS